MADEKDNDDEQHDSDAEGGDDIADKLRELSGELLDIGLH